MPKIFQRKLFFGFMILAAFFFSSPAEASELVADRQVTVRARVLEILKQETKDIPGTDTKSNYQTLKVVILEGEESGKEIIVENDYLNLKEGEVFYLVHTISEFDGGDYYAVADPYRLPALWFFIGLFVLCVFVFGGLPGVRGLLALCGGLLLIFYVLLPGILGGFSPILASIGVASLIIVLGSYITHGFNKTTSSAVLGMLITIIITGLLAYIAIHSVRLSGFESEESVYLNFNTRGAIDFVGLLFGGIVIGLLGVLYDIAISQAVTIEELHRIGPHLDRKIIYKRAIRIGREHIGALVNTLAIAYVGVSLPLILFFYFSADPWSVTLNREIFATEIVRIIVGSIGVILAVPITSVLAVMILVKKSAAPAAELAAEKKKIEHFHSH